MRSRALHDLGAIVLALVGVALLVFFIHHIAALRTWSGERQQLAEALARSNAALVRADS